jgi:hypothetical protein
MLLLAYALAFGVQNKCLFLYGKKPWLDKLLRCTYCLTTHAGWVCWWICTGLRGDWLFSSWWQNALSFVVWALCGAGFGYGLDALIRWLESNTTTGD